MTRVGVIIVAAVLWSLVAGCEGGHEPPVVASLIALAEAEGVAPILVRTTEKTQPVVYRSALPLDENRGPGRRGRVAPAFTPLAGAELRFSYHAPDPVLRKAPIRLRVRARDDAEELLGEKAWTVRRHVLRESWRNARARRPMRSEAAENLRHLAWDLSPFAGRAITLEFVVEAQPPAQEAVETFERAVQDAMPTPFAIIDPRVVNRGAPRAEPAGVWWLFSESEGAAMPEPWPAPTPVIAPTGHPLSTLAALLTVPASPREDEPAARPRSLPAEIAHAGGYAAFLRLGGVLPDRSALAGFNTVQFFAGDETGIGGLTAFLRRLAQSPPSGPVFVAIDLAASADPSHRDRVLTALSAAPELWRFEVAAGLPIATASGRAARVPIVPLSWRSASGPTPDIRSYSDLARVRDRTTSVLGLARSDASDRESPGNATADAPVFFSDPGMTGVVKNGRAVTVFDAPHRDDAGARAFVLARDLAENGPVAAPDPKEDLAPWLDALADFRADERATARAADSVASSAAPPRERVLIRLYAADRPTRFQGVIRCADFESASAADPADATALVVSRGGRNLYFDFQLDSSEQTTFGFSSWPPGLEFETEFYANGDLISQERVRYGGSDLALFGNPGRVDPSAVWEYVSSTPAVEPEESAARVQVWLAPDPTFGGEPFTEPGAWATSWLNENAGF